MKCKSVNSGFAALPWVLSAIVCGSAEAQTPPASQVLTTAQQVHALPTRAEVLQIADDVYVFSTPGLGGASISTFFVTDEGVIVADPMSPNNPRRAEALKAAIALITPQPVRYVVEGHDHVSNAGGSGVFADTAKFVAHRLAAPKIAALHDPLTPVPTILVDDHLTLELGGKKFELYYAGRNHSDNALAILYPARRILWASDWISVNAVPNPDADDFFMGDWIESLRWVEQNLDFDVLLATHASLGTRDNVRSMRVLFEDIVTAIRAAQQQRLADNSSEMVASVRTALLPKYGTWRGFEQNLPRAIRAMLRSGPRQ